MADYSTDIDPGAGELGPWLNWHASATKDGAFLPGTWSVNDQAGRSGVNLTPGCVLDWPSARTGWFFTTGAAGVAPQKKWNKSRAKMEPSPGDGWKKAMAVPVAYMAGNQPAFALWEQGSIAAFQGFVDLMALIRDTAPRQLPLLPLVGYTEHRQVRFSNGSTLIPMFRLIRYVPRPACLPDESVVATQPAGEAWGGSPAAPVQPQPAARQTPPSDAWAAPAPGSNGSGNPAPGTATMAGGRGVLLPTGPVPAGGGGGLIEDDEIPF